MTFSTVVVNVDKEHRRWETSRDHLVTFWLHPVRWSATTPVEVTDWSRRIAIIRTYRALLATINSETLIVQDDVTFTKHPWRDSDADIYLYGGYRGSPHERRLPYERHVCPKAFRVRPPAVEGLLECLKVETRQMCVLWTPMLYNAAFDVVPTAVMTHDG